jgi:hypothetical protein
MTDAVSASASRFSFELARPEDGLELLEILETQAFSGNVSLLYTRRPDAYASFMREGEDVEIVVCRDRASGRIAGMGVSADRVLFVNGAPRRVGYLFGLRARPEYVLRTGVLHRGYARLRELRPSIPDLFLTSILEENEYARRLLEKRRSFMPEYRPLARYTVYAFAAKPGRRSGKAVRRAGARDAPRLTGFLRQEGAAQQFFPFISADSFDRPPFSGLTAEDFMIKEINGEITAAAALWDQSRYKQYIVRGYGGLMRAIRPLSFLFPLLGVPALPPAGSGLRAMFFSLACARENDPASLDELFEGCLRAAPTRSVMIAGAADGHPFASVFASRRHIGYRSRIYSVVWPDMGEPVGPAQGSAPMYFECGLL